MERLREVGVATENEKNQKSSDHMNRTQWIVDGLEGTLVGDKADSRLYVSSYFACTVPNGTRSLQTSEGHV